MKISTKGRYALRLMLDLAYNHTGSFIPIKNISQRQDISDKYLEQIITQLSQAPDLSKAPAVPRAAICLPKSRRNIL